MREYVNDDIHRRIHIFKKIRDNPITFKRILTDDVKKQIDSVLAELHETKAKLRPKEISSRYLADKAGLLDFYDTAYVYLAALCILVFVT